MKLIGHPNMTFVFLFLNCSNFKCIINDMTLVHMTIKLHDFYVIFF